MSLSCGIPLLRQLARLYGVQTAYYDVFHNRRQASDEALLAILHSLGAPVSSSQDVPQAWRERRQARWQRLMEPVLVAWDAKPPFIELRLPSSAAEMPLSGYLTLEYGEQRFWRWHGDELPVTATAEVEGTKFVVKQLPILDRLPLGYHRLTLELPGRSENALIISAPRKCHTLKEEPGGRLWGVFLPLYALHTQRSWGAGDLSDLETFASWVGEMGGRVVATLPLLTAFSNETLEPSPYQPASRLLWNEFYLDINRIPELPTCTSAQALMESPSFRSQIEALRKLPLVDYQQQMALKRQVLEKLCQQLFTEGGSRLDELIHFAETNPLVGDYARFRATGERQHNSWQNWKPPMRDGTLREGDYDEASRRYHLYTQWLTHQQIQDLSQKSREKGLKLYFDLPLGVHPDGFDVWRQRQIFMPDISAGAPPDTVFTSGQDWTFPPLHPDKVREEGYRYFIACLQHHFHYASILRIDHVMGFHRLFCIPNGLKASQGVYLRYRAEEFYAILALESFRYKAIVVGEDLGTVPRYVRPAMKRHGLHRLYVLQYELASDPQAAVHPVPADAIASLNTHDMPPFASFWQGTDIEERLKLGLLDEVRAQDERNTRRAVKEALVAFLKAKGWMKEHEDDNETVMRGCLSLLAASETPIALVNLEDLWAEMQPQNVPGTAEESPNWQRKARHDFENFCQMPQVIDTLRIVDRLRKQGRSTL